MFEDYVSEERRLYKTGRKDARRFVHSDQTPWISMKLNEFSHVTEKVLADFEKEKALAKKRISELLCNAADKTAALEKRRKESDAQINNLPPVEYVKFAGEEDLPREIIVSRRDAERKDEIDKINAGLAAAAEELAAVNREITAAESALFIMSADAEGKLLAERDSASNQLTKYLRGYCEGVNFDPKSIFGEVDSICCAAVARVKGTEKDASSEVVKGDFYD